MVSRFFESLLPRTPGLTKQGPFARLRGKFWQPLWRYKAGSDDYQQKQWFDDPLNTGSSPIHGLEFRRLNAVASLAELTEKFDGALPLVHGMLVQQGRTPNLDFYSFYHRRASM